MWPAEHSVHSQRMNVLNEEGQSSDIYEAYVPTGYPSLSHGDNIVLCWGRCIYDRLSNHEPNNNDWEGNCGEERLQLHHARHASFKDAGIHASVSHRQGRSRPPRHGPNIPVVDYTRIGSNKGKGGMDQTYMQVRCWHNMHVRCWHICDIRKINLLSERVNALLRDADGPPLFARPRVFRTAEGEPANGVRSNCLTATNRAHRHTKASYTKVNIATERTIEHCCKQLCSMSRAGVELALPPAV